ncbi:MAG: hypothetical protein HY423_13755 [Candidatus Lambdaproteobacteria bacterium]|nr:hypothetical protein [Candidatus Lambdaproteobacteria bacterium]
MALFAARSAAFLAAALLALASWGSPLARAQTGPGGNPMRDMMRQMMQGYVPPPGMSADALPEPDSEGTRLMARYCAQCHDLPSPRYKTAAEWPAVFDRMNARMRMMGGGMMGGGMMGGGMMGMGRVEAPGASEGAALLAYLQRNAMRPARPEELQAGDPADRAVFLGVCAQCHAPPSPSLHPPDAWLGIVARMQANMQLMDKPQPTPQQREAIVRLLQAAARWSANHPFPRENQ